MDTVSLVRMIESGRELNVSVLQVRQNKMECARVTVEAVNWLTPMETAMIVPSTNTSKMANAFAIQALFVTQSR